ALTRVPPIVLLLMVMPVLLGRVTPVAVMVPLPVLVTLPVTVEFWILMQLIAAELVIGPVDTPTSLMAHCAQAAGAPVPINSAATELDARSARKRLPQTPIPLPTCRLTSRLRAPPGISKCNPTVKLSAG